MQSVIEYLDNNLDIIHKISPVLQIFCWYNFWSFTLQPFIFLIFLMIYMLNWMANGGHCNDICFFVTDYDSVSWYLIKFAFTPKLTFGLIGALRWHQIRWPMRSCVQVPTMLFPPHLKLNSTCWAFSIFQAPKSEGSVGWYIINLPSPISLSIWINWWFKNLLSVMFCWCILYGEFVVKICVLC